MARKSTFAYTPCQAMACLDSALRAPFLYFALLFPLFGLDRIGVYLECINHLIDVDRQLRARMMKMDFCFEAVV